VSYCAILKLEVVTVAVLGMKTSRNTLWVFEGAQWGQLRLLVSGLSFCFSLVF
jgi:hypothetical protein